MGRKSFFSIVYNSIRYSRFANVEFEQVIEASRRHGGSQALHLSIETAVHVCHCSRSQHEPL
jgi:hypothetical protein